VGGIPRGVYGLENAARGDLDDAPVVDVAAALRRQVRNQPRKAVSGFFIILFLFLCAFPGDEIMASSPASP
jgi:hypothetical protein